MLILWLSGCAPVQRDGSRRYLLGTSSIKGNKSINKEELEALIPQKPNRRFLGLPFFPYLWLYQIGSSWYTREPHQRKLVELTIAYREEARLHENDPVKLLSVQRRYARKIEKARLRVEKGNWWMRVLGEEPVYFNQVNAKANAEKMHSYLFNNGFFENTVNFTPDTSLGRIRTVYTITENRPTVIREVEFRSRDLDVDSLLKSGARQSLLVKNKRYDGDVFDAERTRIENLLRNSGYFGFTRQQVVFTVNDTITTPKDSLMKSVDIAVIAVRPPNQETHKRYRIDSVKFDVLPIAGLEENNVPKKTEFYRIDYSFSGKSFSPRILNSMIYLRPGDIYSVQRERDTQRRLSASDQFQFVNYSFDSTGGSLKARMRAIPLDKYQLSADLGLNVIQLQQTPGPFANLAFKIRNIFNGLENLEMNLRGGIEAATGYTDTRLLYRSTELSFNTALNFPQLLFPLGAMRYRLGALNPRTQVGVGYNYVDRPEYARTNIKTSLVYNLQPTPQRLFSISLVDLNILNTRKLSREFGQLLDTLELQGNNLKNSFRESFVSDINFTYIYNTSSFFAAPKNAHYLRIALESGGTTLSILPNQRRWVDRLFNNDSLQYFQYIRWNADFRRYWPVLSRGSFVARVNMGGVHSYGITKDRIPPYEKYFFAGGSNSIRAWLPRRVGPGNAKPQVTSNGLTIEAPGEFLMEGNLELRGFLMRFFGDINYALFMDVGNVWHFKKPERKAGERPVDRSGTFQLNSFARQLAVGTGFGLRYDLKYFVFRLDFGLKVYDPYREKFVLNEFKINNPFNTRNSNFLNVNLGVGYPF